MQNIRFLSLPQLPICSQMNWADELMEVHFIMLWIWKTRFPKKGVIRAFRLGTPKGQNFLNIFIVLILSCVSHCLNEKKREQEEVAAQEAEFKQGKNHISDIWNLKVCILKFQFTILEWKHLVTAFRDCKFKKHHHIWTRFSNYFYTEYNTLLRI